MHELSITEGILSIALGAAGGRRITAINLVIGDLSSFVDDSVQFYFDILSRGTPAESAALSFLRQPATAMCADCGHVFETKPPFHRSVRIAGAFTWQSPAGGRCAWKASR